MFKMQLNNVYAIDSMMFGYRHYASCYLIKGKELAMVDTGMPERLDDVLAGIKANGFRVEDITRIFVTHCEHPDHSGNVASILELAPNAKAYCNPIGEKNLLDPGIQHRERMKTLPPEMWQRFVLPKPTPKEKIVLLKDGDTFDLGDDVKLRIKIIDFHQPSGLVVYDLKNNGLFCNDLTGNYFADCGYHIVLHPPDSQFFVEYEYIKELLKNPPAHLYLGHFGIIEDAPTYLKETFDHETWMIEECAKAVKSGHPEKVMEIIRDKNLESAKNLLKRGDQKLYDYCTKEHIPPQAQTFADLFLSKYGN
jgi:glyoxylase-like metal-dependent hydrolase (beta-lactamase superfamily II)